MAEIATAGLARLEMTSGGRSYPPPPQGRAARTAHPSPPPRRGAIPEDGIEDPSHPHQATGDRLHIYVRGVLGQRTERQPGLAFERRPS
jgi:hypothetical protein